MFIKASAAFIKKHKKGTRSFNTIRETVFGNIRREPYGSNHQRELKFVGKLKHYGQTDSPIYVFRRQKP
jgi:hypothetical protein